MICWIFKSIFVFFQVHSFHRAAVINNHQRSGFRNLILSHFWLLEVQNLGVCKSMCPLNSLEKNFSLLLSNFCWIQADLGIPHLVAASFQSVFLPSSGLLFLRASSYNFFIGTPGIEFRVCPIHYNLILTN